MEYKIRKLTRADRVTLTGLIKKFVEKSGRTELVELAPSSDVGKKKEQENENAIKETALSLFKDMMEIIDKDMAVWFSDLIGVTPDKFETLSFDIEIDIIDQIMDSKGFTDFFLKGLQIRKKIIGFAGRLKN